MTSKHITNCPCCFKIFKRQGCYEKHIFTCQRKQDQYQDQDQDKLPNAKQLYEMITLLTEKYNSVQSELENMKQHIRTKNKKIDVITWLNEQEKPEHSWYSCIEQMEIIVSDLEYIFKSGFIDGTVEIINKYIEKEGMRETFKCFEQKKNIIYMFDEEWKECKTDDFKKIFNLIYNKLMVTFDDYKMENEGRMSDENFQSVYCDNFMKLLCVDIPFEKKITRIKNKIYMEYKESFKTITEMDI